MTNHLCVGGPYSGCIVDIATPLRHGRRVEIDDWMVGPGTIPPVPTFSEKNEPVTAARQIYTLVQFSGQGGERWFLAHGTDNGMWVLDELTQMARRRTLGDKA